MQKIKLNLPDKFFAEEPRELLVSSDTKRVWAVLLDLLVEFDRVCKLNDVSYFLDSGTLLGAVRHKGFIPWDDDMDVVMLREDYNKLLRLAPQMFQEPYFFQTNDTDPGSARGHAQLRNSSTTYILKSETYQGKPLFDFNQGIFLDIFALDAVPDDEAELHAFRKELSKIKARIRKIKFMRAFTRCLPWYHLAPATLRDRLRMGWLKVKKMLTGRDPLKLACDELEQTVQRYNGKGMKRCANFSLNPERPDSQLFPIDLYRHQRDYDFEGFHFPGPENYDAILSGHYGNWRKHVIGSSFHGGLLIDAERPYTYYLNR